MFANSEYLYLLFFVPVFFVFFVLRIRAQKRLLRSYIQDTCLKAITGSSSTSKILFKQGLLFMVFVFLILALARPQSSQKETTKTEVRGAEIMILADVSKSMLVRDMGGLSRLEVMKKELSRLLQLLSHQRVGLISFSGSAVLVSPLTLDHSALSLFIKALSVEDHVLQGSDFGSALQLAMQALKRGGTLPQDSKARVILLASDGEDNEQQALSFTKEVAKQNIRVFSLGFGTRKGGLIPLYDKWGNKTGYKKDKTGQPVVSRFSEHTLKQIAKIGQGAFYVANLGTHTIQKIYTDIQAVGEGALSVQSQNQYKEWYQYFVLMGLLFGSFYFLIGEKIKNNKQAWHDYK